MDNFWAGFEKLAAKDDDHSYFTHAQLKRKAVQLGVPIGALTGAAVGVAAAAHGGKAAKALGIASAAGVGAAGGYGFLRHVQKKYPYTKGYHRSGGEE